MGAEAAGEMKFELEAWVIFEGLKGAPELNGKLGQVMEFIEEKGRYSVFVPELVDNASEIFGFDIPPTESRWKKYTNGKKNENRLLEMAMMRGNTDLTPEAYRKAALALFPAYTDIAYRRKHQSTKLLKPENLIPYDGPNTEVQLIPSSSHPPSGRWRTLTFPAAHPLFQEIKSNDNFFGNSPIFNFYGCPLAIIKLPCNRSVDRATLDNQIATFLNADAESGLAPPEWQSFVGPVIICRPNGQPISDVDMEVIWEIASSTVEEYTPYDEGDEVGVIPSRDLNPKALEKRVRNYLSANDDWNRKSMDILNSQTGEYAGLSMDQREELLVKHQKTVPARGQLSSRFDLQHLVRREGGLCA